MTSASGSGLEVEAGSRSLSATAASAPTETLDLSAQAFQQGLLSPVYWIVLGVLCVSLLAAFWRLWRGPSLPDRVVALDLIALISVGFIAIYDIVTNEAVFLDIAMIMALIAFLGTVAFARFIERGAR